MSAIEIILASIGGTAALVVSLGWLSKSFVTHLLDKDIQQYKFDLKRQLDEHSIRFEKLHQRRDEVIATLYERIVEFYNAIDRFIDFAMLLSAPVLETGKVKLWSAVDSFREYSEKHRIYFSEEICSRLDSLYQAADTPTTMLMVAIESQASSSDDQPLIDAWKAAKENLVGDVQAIRRAIETDFRKLLGVSTSMSDHHK